MPGGFVTDRGGCPDDNDIAAFLSAELSDAERAAIEVHCAGCARCCETLAHAAHDSAAGSPVPGGRSIEHELASAVQGVLGEPGAAEAQLGKRIGRFELLAVEGRGQFGVVYRARDSQLGRLVAVKLMRRAGGDRRALEALFRTEAAAAARLQHPSIVTLHDYGECDGAPYLVLELLEGETLRSRLARGGRLAPPEALAIASDVTRALVEAHAAGVIHRDVKPSNVFLCTSGQTKLLDLGLAQLHDALDPAGEPHVAPARAGTPRYMAPELFAGEPADPCSDVYAVGVTLLEMLTGAPVGASSVDAWLAGARLPRRLRLLLRTATAADRLVRFQRADELLAALVDARRRLAWPSRVRLGIAVGAAALVASAAVAYRSIAPSHPSGTPAVAVIGFSDLSSRGDAAWLAAGLPVMLDSDLASSPAMRLVSPDLVAHARADLALADADLDEPARQRLRTYLAADYLVFGSFASLPSDRGDRTRVDVRVEDAHGQLVASVSETGGDGELLDVVARIASRLRVRLAGSELTPDELRVRRASLPATTAAVRLYTEGLRQWQRADLTGARDLLTRATAAEPAFPLAHSALSQVLHALGEEPRMREEARLAFERSGGLRREERWAVEARYREAIGEWPKARALRKTLHELFPDDLEYGLELADAFDRHGQWQEALVVIGELRRLPPPQRDDPRIDLYEVSAQFDFHVRKALALAAADKAQALGARWLLARSRLREAAAERELGELDRALAAGDAARAIYKSLGDREGLSIALYEVVTTQLLIGAPISSVIASYETALDLERQIGNNDAVATMLANIAFEYLMAGDPAQAALRIDQREQLATGTWQDQTERLRAMQWHAQGELTRAFAQLEHVRRAFFETHESPGVELRLLGEVLLDQGQLAEARARLELYLAQPWPPDGTRRLAGQFALIRLEVEEGQLARAEADARASLAICERVHDVSDLVTAQSVLARVLVARHRFDEATTVAAAALQLATRLETVPEWLEAQLALAGARVGLHPQDVEAALADAGAALRRARERGLVGPAYEAQLAIGEISAAAGRPAAAELHRLADEAEAHGFGLIARKARAAAATAH